MRRPSSRAIASVGSSHVRIVWSGSSRCASSRMRFQASLADSCIGTRKRREFFPGREMLRVRYKNVNRVLTGEIGEDEIGEVANISFHHSPRLQRCPPSEIFLRACFRAVLALLLPTPSRCPFGMAGPAFT